MFGQINCCQRLWKFALSPINHPIWSHWSSATICMIYPNKYTTKNYLPKVGSRWERRKRKRQGKGQKYGGNENLLPKNKERIMSRFCVEKILGKSLTGGVVVGGVKSWDAFSEYLMRSFFIRSPHTHTTTTITTTTYSTTRKSHSTIEPQAVTFFI